MLLRYNVKNAPIEFAIKSNLFSHFLLIYILLFISEIVDISRPMSANTYSSVPGMCLERTDSRFHKQNKCASQSPSFIPPVNEYRFSSESGNSPRKRPTSSGFGGNNWVPFDLQSSRTAKKSVFIVLICKLLWVADGLVGAWGSRWEFHINSLATNRFTIFITHI